MLLPTTKAMIASKSRIRATTPTAHINQTNTFGLMEHVPMPVQNVTAKQTSTMMKLPYKIAKQNKVIIMGTHEQSGLCSIPTSPMPVQQANGILLLNKTNRELPNYHHASLGSPAKSTLLQAIRRGHLTTFQGINFQAHIQTSFTHQSHSAGSSRPISKHLCSTNPSRLRSQKTILTLI